VKRKIRKAAVLGAGVMGSTIAAHLANAGLPVYLLDIVPDELDNTDRKKGITQESLAFRNKLAIAGIRNAQKASPAAFFLPYDANLITPGNLEDHIERLSEVDWIIEVVAENLETKKSLFRKVEAVRKPGTIVSTNTSGLSINKMAEETSQDFKEHFLGTHFFNPPRYMKLMEIIPGNSTNQEIVDFMADFCERQLGKGVVYAKDTPDFIANRIGVYGAITAIKLMMENGYTVEEVDAITGPPMGRPKSATFRTADIVGLDVLVHVIKNVYNNIEDQKEKEAFVVPELLNRMVEAGLLGDKAQKGFYKKELTAEGSQIFALDYNTLEYAPQKKAKFPALDSLRQIADPAKRVRTLLRSEDRDGQLAWPVLKKTLLYCATKIPEIADDVQNIDRAMKWGFHWDIGPFEVWDAIGVRESVKRMESEGERIPENVTQMLRAGKERFYEPINGRVRYFDFGKADYQELEEKPQIIILPSLKERNLIKSNPGASLIDIGDGVACLEFHSPNSAIGYDFIDMINYSVSVAEKDFQGLVITNLSQSFSVGANLMIVFFEVQRRNWDGIYFLVSRFQGACRRIKYAECPVVVAPSGMALGGGCEICMAASKVRAHAETYIGLVEVGVGVIPAGGGCLEVLLRNTQWVPDTVPSASPVGSRPDLTPYAARAFETIALAKVSTSAKEAQKLGYLRPEDRITMNRDHLLYDAKETVIAMTREGYCPPRPRDDIRVTGRSGKALMELLVYSMVQGQHVSDYDAHIANKLATVLTGGNVEQNTLVTEEYLLELEREAFVSLCGEKKTQDRMQHMLQTNKPLRN
jgi:3-hydroxyacyl-CoA dehydrogenase